MTDQEKLQCALNALMDIAEENSNVTPLGCRSIATDALKKLGYARAWVQAESATGDA